MTASGLWQQIGRGDNLITKLVRLAFLGVAAVLFYFFGVLPLTWPQQVVCGLLFLLIALAVSRSSDSYIVTLTLMIMSLFCTFRYGYWRFHTLVNFFQDPGNRWGVLDIILHGAADPVGDVRLRGDGAGIFPDNLAAAARARCAARRRERVAAH